MIYIQYVNYHYFFTKKDQKQVKKINYGLFQSFLAPRYIYFEKLN